MTAADPRYVFVPLTSDWNASDEEHKTNRVRDGRVEIEDDEMSFPLIRLGVSSDHGVEPSGYVREYAELTPTQACTIARGLYRAARIAREHIKAIGFTEASWLRDDEEGGR